MSDAPGPLPVDGTGSPEMPVEPETLAGPAGVSDAATVGDSVTDDDPRLSVDPSSPVARPAPVDAPFQVDPLDLVEPEVARTLRERARRLGAVRAVERDDDRAEVLLFRLRDERYAVGLDVLRAVQRARGLTAVPCAPVHVAGVLNVRGEVVTVLDLAATLGLTGTAAPLETAQVLLAELTPGRVGLLVDEVLGAQDLARSDLTPALSGREFALGIAAGSIVVLDLEQLLGSGRFDVHEEVS